VGGESPDAAYSATGSVGGLQQHPYAARVPRSQLLIS
jgi:hypothetical protein